MVTGQKNLVQMKDQLTQQLQQWTALKALRANLVSEIDDTKTKLAAETQDSRGAESCDREAACGSGSARQADGGAFGLREEADAGR